MGQTAGAPNEPQLPELPLLLGGQNPEPSNLGAHCMIWAHFGPHFWAARLILELGWISALSGVVCRAVYRGGGDEDRHQTSRCPLFFATAPARLGKQSVWKCQGDMKRNGRAVAMLQKKKFSRLAEMKVSVKDQNEKNENAMETYLVNDIYEACDIQWNYAHMDNVGSTFTNKSDTYLLW